MIYNTVHLVNTKSVYVPSKDTLFTAPACFS